MCATSVLTLKTCIDTFLSIQFSSNQARSSHHIVVQECLLQKARYRLYFKYYLGDFLFILVRFLITCPSLLLFAQIVPQDEIPPETVKEESKTTTKSKGKL